MQKDFDTWNELKKSLENNDKDILKLVKESLLRAKNMDKFTYDMELRNWRDAGVRV